MKATSSLPGSGKEVGEGAICFSFLDLLRTEHPVFLLSHLPVLEYLEAVVILIKKKKKRNVPHCFRFPWLIAAYVLAARARGFGAAGTPNPVVHPGARLGDPRCFWGSSLRGLTASDPFFEGLRVVARDRGQNTAVLRLLFLGASSWLWSCQQSSVRVRVPTH